MTIILPCAGSSSRFPGTRPKWILTQPNGHIMADEALSRIKYRRTDRVIVTILKSHLDKYFSNGIDGVKTAFGYPVEVCILPDPTESQVATLIATILTMKVDGPVFFKDCDNRFDFEPFEGSYVCTSKLQGTISNPEAKSYAVVDSEGHLINIVEKKIVSSNFCAGGYGFHDASQFIQEAVKPGKRPNFISEVIFRLILHGKALFTAPEVTRYEDWGTLEAWQRYRTSFRTFFIDVDGILLTNGAQHTSPYWRNAQPIPGNVDWLRELVAEGKSHIVLTTARPESWRKGLTAQLKKFGIYFDQLVMGLPHSQRVLINDFKSPTAPYPSAVAVNVPRGSGSLPELL